MSRLFLVKLNSDVEAGKDLAHFVYAVRPGDGWFLIADNDGTPRWLDPATTKIGDVQFTAEEERWIRSKREVEHGHAG